MRLKYKELTDSAEQEPRVKKKKPEEREAIITAIQQELDGKLEVEIEQITKAYQYRVGYMNGIFKVFTPGSGLIYTVKDETFGEIRIPAIFIGYIIDPKKTNPFLPSAVKLRFAMSDSSRYMTIAASFSDHINQIKGASVGLTEHELNDMTQNWQKHTENANKNRTLQYIVTGNLLQAYSQLKGKLVSFTTIKGNQKKGILVNITDKEEIKKVFANVLVPIIRALPLIKSMRNDDTMSVSGNISLSRNYNGYKLIAPASKAKGGEFYLNRKLHEVLTHGIFNKTGNKMVADIDVNDIQRVVEVMQNEFNCSVTVSATMYEFIKGNSPKQYEEESPITSELVSLEAKLMLMLNNTYSMNGAGQMLSGVETITKSFESIPIPSKCNSLSEVFDALIQVQDLMLQYQSQRQDIPEFVLMRRERLKAREIEIRNEGLSGTDYHPNIKLIA